MSDPARISSTPLRPNVRVIVLAVFTIFACLLMFSRPAIRQNESYHAFIDQRTLWGMPNALNVISNAGFLLAGIYGLCIVTGRRDEKRVFQGPKEIYAYLVFFAAAALISIGSGFYHLMPNDQRLVWDRLPMTLAFMALFAATISERIRVQLGFRLLPVLLVTGLATVLYWHFGQCAGVGDLRPYFLVQFYPLFAIPLLILLGPARYTRGNDLVVVVIFYGLAKVAESFDSAIFALSSFISGHSLKHILAAVGIFWIARMLALRQPSCLIAPSANTRSNEIGHGCRRNKTRFLFEDNDLAGEQHFT